MIKNMNVFKNRHVLKTDTKASIGEDETQETVQAYLNVSYSPF